MGLGIVIVYVFNHITYFSVIKQTNEDILLCIKIIQPWQDKNIYSQNCVNQKESLSALSTQGV